VVRWDCGMSGNPIELILCPTFVRGWVGLRLIQGAGVDFKPLWDCGIEEHQGGSAAITKRTFAIRVLEDLWFFLEPSECAGAEETPRHCGSAAGFSAIDAMAK
jgi:hypothetical protein